MTYAIIKVAGKQYRVREGEQLLVDRLAHEDGASFAPTVLLAGGNGAPTLDPAIEVRARVLGQVKGPKIRIGKYKKRTGYRRHNGFRASLTRIEIESIGAKTARAAARSKAPEKAGKPKAAEKPPRGTTRSDLPEGYADLTVAELKAAAREWSADALAAALAHEQENAKRKGAIAALESALAQQGGES